MNAEIKREAVTLVSIWAAAGIAAVALYQSGMISFDLAHMVAEFVVVLIAASVFLLAWNGRRYLDNGALRLIAIAYLFVGILNLFHTISYAATWVFPGQPAELPEHLWVAARLLQASALATAPYFTRRKPSMGAAMALLALIALAVVSLQIIAPQVRLRSAEGTLTVVGLVVEAVILVGLAVALAAFGRQKRLLGDRVYYSLAGSILLTIISEILLTAMPGGEGLADLVGHFINMAAFYMIYKAIIETSFTRPMELLFSDLVSSQASLQKEKDFIDGVLDSASALILVLDTEGKIIRFNRFMQDITGHNSEEMAGRYIWETRIFPGNQEQVRDFFEQQLSARSPNNFERSILSDAGEEIEVTWTTALQPDGAGNPGLLITTGIDISDRKKVENELRYMSSHDILTGLYNRTYFEAEMLRLAASDEFPVSIVIGDLDGLKQVNDNEGHIVGDRLIQRAAHILRSSFRSKDIIARIGGDEFAILLPGADSATAIQSGKRVRSILEAHNRNNPENPISLSLGYATCLAGYQLMEAFKKADSAMYAQKVSHHDVIDGS